MHFLITAGGTREYIDPVRFISNASSGKMGCALAKAAIKNGHKVTLITTPSVTTIVKNIKTVKAETATQMFKAVKKYFTKCDCLIMAAAVADYTVKKTVGSKIKKSNKTLTINLKPTTDILKWAGQNKKNNQLTVGFALEDRNLRTNAEQKLKTKKLDIIIANSPATINSNSCSVQIKTKTNKWLNLPKTTKTAAAAKIISIIENILLMN